jgi:hypothetical protein
MWYLVQGDFLQLPPVCDDPIYANLQSKPALKQLGQTIWELFLKDVWVLDKMVRQDPNSKWAVELDKLRDEHQLHGTEPNTRANLDFWNNLWVGRKKGEWKDAETDNKTCILCAQRRDVVQYNTKYLESRKNIHKFVVNATTGSKKHVKGMISLINPCLYVSKGSIVKLTRNIAPELMLYNGSRGNVVDVVYSPDENGYHCDGMQNAFIIVDFKEYVGPPMWKGAPATWVAIERCTLKCENKCCSRTGYPLMVGKADSIHCSQGMTIGDGQQFERVLGKWSGEMEKKIGPGLFYVFASRCKSIDNVALVDQMTRSDLRSIASTHGFLATKTQDEKLRRLARVQKEARKLQYKTDNPKDHIELGSIEDLKVRMHWFYTTCKEKYALNGKTGTEVTTKERIAHACLDQWKESFVTHMQFDFEDQPVQRRDNAVRRASKRGTKQ